MKMKRKSLTGVVIAIVIFVSLVAIVGLYVINTYSKGDEFSKIYSVPFNPILLSFNSTITDMFGKAIVLKEGGVFVEKIDKYEGKTIIKTELATDSAVLRFNLERELFRNINPDYVRVYDKSGIEFTEVTNFRGADKGVFYDADTGWIYIKFNDDDIVIKNQGVATTYGFIADGCVLENKSDDDYCFIEDMEHFGDRTSGTDGIEPWSNF